MGRTLGPLTLGLLLAVLYVGSAVYVGWNW